jgi:hypothetical protein
MAADKWTPSKPFKNPDVTPGGFGCIMNYEDPSGAKLRVTVAHRPDIERFRIVANRKDPGSTKWEEQMIPAALARDVVQALRELDEALHNSRKLPGKLEQKTG